jgi:hypothetical protein
MLALSFVLLFCSIANLALGIANAVVCGFMGYIGYGIWGSIICFVAGVSGIVASLLRAQSLVIAHLVLAIIAAVSSTVQLAMGSGSAVVDHAVVKTINNIWVPYKNNDQNAIVEFHDMWIAAHDSRCPNSGWKETKGPIATDALLASFAAIQGIVAIISCIISCRATVCPKGVTNMPWEEFNTQVHIVTPK